MKVVVDANMVMAALVRNNKAREVLASEKFDFLSPEFIVQEINKYKEELLEKTDLDKDSFDLLIGLILENVTVVPKEQYEEYLEEAVEIIKEDIKDAPYVACYLALKCDGIWTNDPDFRDKKLKILSTKDLLDLI